jgi:hypothetical protein
VMGVSSWLNVEVVVKRVFFIYLVFIENKKSFGVGLRIYKFRTRIYLTCEWLVAGYELDVFWRPRAAHEYEILICGECEHVTTCLA